MKGVNTMTSDNNNFNDWTKVETVGMVKQHLKTFVEQFGAR